MTGGQIAALICAILLLLPGGCFLIFGIGFAADENEYGLAFLAFLLLPIAAVILTGAGLLFWLAFRRWPARDGT
jgi:membrane protein implicated in regulation of membrane protease activity